MSDVLTFCDKTVEAVSLEIKETQKQLNKNLENEERKEIKANLRKNEEINRKHLQQRKNKKFSYLKLKPTTPMTKTTEFEHGLQFQRNKIILGEINLCKHPP